MESRSTTDFSLAQFSQKHPDEADDIRLDFIVAAARQELRNPAGSQTVIFKKVSFQNCDGLLSFRRFAQGAKPGDNVPNSCPVIAQDKVKIIGILVFSAIFECQRLQNGIAAGASPTSRSIVPTCAAVSEDSAAGSMISEGTRPPTTTTSSIRSPSFVAA
ncbi:MAG: hypothetical protein PHG30_08690 [Eubacteriales bacterium]|nr:hypothetical protein [Alphaproteobacteria bacterium]MDD2302624.1 hypothetical protein [Eubacteriales bacterium]HNS45244.1 hypothetical protein [Alphaproteobacteria bacterium]HQN26046.1 hypothetical protein [Syntrophales bacterium]HQP28739.1 hypothetical protein [Syntrophales bacterium]